MTRPVPNLQSALAEVRSVNGKALAFLISPWNSFFQQFVQPAPAVAPVTLPSPFTANANGTVIIHGAATITLTRGTTNISLTGLNPAVIPISVGDSVAWTGGATVQFLGA